MYEISSKEHNIHGSLHCLSCLMALPEPEEGHTKKIGVLKLITHTDFFSEFRAGLLTIYLLSRIIEGSQFERLIILMYTIKPESVTPMVHCINSHTW